MNSIICICLLVLLKYATPFSFHDESSTSSSTITRTKKLFPYQQDGVERLIKSQRILLADEMGLGKTVQCIEAMNKIGKKDATILIICPKSVLGVWESELQSWLDLPYKVQITTSKHFQQPVEGSVTLINYDLCHKFRDELLETNVYDVLICDEAHYLKSLDAKRTKAIFGNGSEMPCIPAINLWLLTGTPVLNRPVELYPLLRAIRPMEFPSFRDFASRYCDPQTTRDRRGNYHVDYSGAMNLAELSRRLDSVMLRRYKADVLKQLPPKFRSCKCLLDSGEADFERERIQEFLLDRDYRYDEGLRMEDFGSEAASLVQYIGRDIDMSDPDMRNQIMGCISSIRRETALKKVDVSAELLENIILSEKVVVFAHHRDVILRLVEIFGKRAVCVLGGMSTEERSDAVARFQNDPDVRIFAGSIRAAGVGLTLTASSHVVFLEMDWSPGVMAQAEDRCHRVGQVDSVQVEYYVFKNTIDEWIAKSLLSKQLNIDQILPESLAGSSSSACSYIFDFGKHSGVRLEDAPRSYVQYLIQNQVWRQRPQLWSALFLKGMVSTVPPIAGIDVPNMSSVDSTTNETIEAVPDNSLVSSDRAVLYKFDFGKHSGEMWDGVPQSYRDWIIKEGVWKSRSTLKSALINSEIVLDDTIIPPSPLSSTQDMVDTKPSSKCSPSQSRQPSFPIKSFRWTVHCPYIIKELDARNIPFDNIERNKINKLKKRLLQWHEENYPNDTNREIALLACDPDEIFLVFKTKS